MFAIVIGGRKRLKIGQETIDRSEEKIQRLSCLAIEDGS
jgi:hypothetical protein